LICALTVWWQRGRYISRVELSVLQELAYLAVTGVMKMTPTAAVEILLGFPFLYVKTEAEVQARICKLMCNQQWKLTSSNFCHAR
jgi:hypothetical protein